MEFPPGSVRNTAAGNAGLSMRRSRPVTEWQSRRIMNCQRPHGSTALPHSSVRIPDSGERPIAKRRCVFTLINASRSLSLGCGMSAHLSSDVTHARASSSSSQLMSAAKRQITVDLVGDHLFVLVTAFSLLFCSFAWTIFSRQGLRTEPKHRREAKVHRWKASCLITLLQRRALFEIF
jgi:hypothetical protein